FLSSLKPQSVQAALELFDANGDPVAGTSVLIMNLDNTEVIGVRFDPATPLQNGQRYTARVRGGSDGISTLDGRMMPDHFVWPFTVDAALDSQEQPPAGLTLQHEGVGRVGEAIAFTAEVKQGGTVTYTWDFGDSATATGATVNHVYTTVGTYVVRVTATNSLGAISEEIVVQVSEKNQAKTIQLFLPIVMR
ncbi:MAG: PKD domain-containing protein, partial [Caldilineaceae bacterium]|nr:PKD domain-containing protein [Caldilineaceae bacterium]